MLSSREKISLSVANLVILWSGLVYESRVLGRRTLPENPSFPFEGVYMRFAERLKINVDFCDFYIGPLVLARSTPFGS